jgi:hypothetical protein
MVDAFGRDLDDGTAQQVPGRSGRGHAVLRMMGSSGFGLLALQLMVEQVFAMRLATRCQPTTECPQETHVRQFTRIVFKRRRIKTCGGALKWPEPSIVRTGMISRF